MHSVAHSGKLLESLLAQLCSKSGTIPQSCTGINVAQELQQTGSVPACVPSHAHFLKLAGNGHSQDLIICLGVAEQIPVLFYWYGVISDRWMVTTTQNY